MKQYTKTTYISRPQEYLSLNRDWFMRDQIENTKNALLYEIEQDIKIDILDGIHGKQITASLIIPEQIKVVKPEINPDSFFINAQLSMDLKKSEDTNNKLNHKLSLLSFFLIMCSIELSLMLVFIISFCYGV